MDGEGIQRPQRLMFGDESKCRATGSSPKATPSTQSSEALEAWLLVQDTTNIAVLEAFVERYANTVYAERAWVRLNELKRRDVIVPPAEFHPKSSVQVASEYQAPATVVKPIAKARLNSLGRNPSPTSRLQHRPTCKPIRP